MNAVLHTRAEVVVPDLSGQRLEQALDTLSPLSLSLAKDGIEFDEGRPAGTILRQAPPAGMKVREGKVVRVTISSGGKVVFVPELTGKSLSEAQNLLRAAGMAPGALTQIYSQARPHGEVLEQNPEAGAVGSRGQMVDLRISKGPPPEGTLLMPDFISRPVSMAKEWAEDNGLSLETSDEASDTVMPGVVLRQDPAPDAVIKPGQSLRVTVTIGGKTLTDRPGMKWIRYQVPTGGDKARVKVVVRDDSGEKIVFDQLRDPGALVEIPVEPQGPARARVYMGGVLVEERVLE
jgi:serine/threonine-protein kinase